MQQKLLHIFEQCTKTTMRNAEIAKCIMQSDTYLK